MRTRRQPEGMPDLQKAVKAVKRAEWSRNEEIYRAYLAGNSLRAIAMEADLSHETVRVVVERVAEWVETERRILASPSRGLTVDAILRGERSKAKRQAKLDWLTNVKRSDT